MHPQAQLSAHRALTSECSHLENELSKEKARNEVLGAKCDELEARNHSMKEAYDQVTVFCLMMYYGCMCACTYV